MPDIDNPHVPSVLLNSKQNCKASAGSASSDQVSVCTPSYLDARWLLGLAVGRDAPVFGHET